SDALETQQNGHRYREQNNKVNAFFLNIGYRFTFDGYNNF
ncbi:MAG: PorT family protein, partial [Riemerella sp.]|nr:PorT family protein [Riemerella sp.]